MPVSLYILKRILVSIPTILIVSMIGFFLMRFDIQIGPFELPFASKDAEQQVIYYRLKNPIDPLAGYRNNPQISPAALTAIEKRLSLDKPMHVQYWAWLSNLFHVNLGAFQDVHPERFLTLDLGKTFTGDDVSRLIIQRAGNSLMLNLVSVVLNWLIAIPLGIYAALHWRSLVDRLLTVLAAVGMAFPSFVLALIAAVFAVKTGWFPLGGIKSDGFETFGLLHQILDIGWHLILPVAILTVLGIAGLQRQMRGNLLDVLQAEYVRTARAKGLPEHTVIYRHAVRTAINPLITMLGYEFSALLSGALLIEIVLGFPGLGSLMYKAVLETDTNMVMASLMMSSVMLVLGNLLADILLKVVDPRIELQ